MAGPEDELDEIYEEIESSLKNDKILSELKKEEKENLMNIVVRDTLEEKD